VNLTKAEAAALGRKREQPVKQPGDLLAIFVTGKLANPLNGTPWIWQKRTRYAKGWKERVAMALLERHNAEGAVMTRLEWMRPKRVTFHASVFHKFDSDGLEAACKPIRDALVECGVISGDAERDGHAFVYEQRIDRAHRGVEIHVGLMTPEQRAPLPETPQAGDRS
jgi:hypothetical protein